VEDILPFKAFVISKREPSSYFPCKIDILWEVPFLKIGVILIQGSYSMSITSYYTKVLSDAPENK